MDMYYQMQKVSVTVINEHWNPDDDLRYRTATTRTDPNGYFTVDVQTSHSTAYYSYTIPGPINLRTILIMAM